jgi:hypothetical protein
LILAAGGSANQATDDRTGSGTDSGSGLFFLPHGSATYTHNDCHTD